MQIEFQTSVGRKRKNNQDKVGVYKNKESIVLAIVADGMGGHRAGDTASDLAVTGLGEVWEQTELTTQSEISKWLVEHIQEENGKIFDKGTSNPDMYGMGTTIVAGVILNEEIIFANVGDSRAYIIRDNHIKQVTDDHSLVNELVKNGEISPTMAASHPQRNILIRSVGVPGNVEVDISLLKAEDADIILMCSDGLTNMLSDDTIKEIILSHVHSLNEAVCHLVDAANEAGGTDNITALLIECNHNKRQEVVQ